MEPERSALTSDEKRELTQIYLSIVGDKSLDKEVKSRRLKFLADIMKNGITDLNRQTLSSWKLAYEEGETIPPPPLLPPPQKRVREELPTPPKKEKRPTLKKEGKEIQLPRAVYAKRTIEIDGVDEKYQKVAQCMSKQWIWLCKGLMLWDPLHEYTLALGPDRDQVTNLINLILRHARDKSEVLYFDSVNQICKTLKPPTCNEGDQRSLFQVGRGEFQLHADLQQLRGQHILDEFLPKFEGNCFDKTKITKKAPSRKNPFVKRIPHLIQELTEKNQWGEYNRRVKKVQEWFGGIADDCLIKGLVDPDETPGEEQLLSSAFSDMSISDEEARRQEWADIPEGFEFEESPPLLHRDPESWEGLSEGGTRSPRPPFSDFDFENFY